MKTPVLFKHEKILETNGGIYEEMELKHTVSVGTILCMAFLVFNLLVYDRNVRQMSFSRIFAVNKSTIDDKIYLIRNKKIQGQFRNRVNRVEKACKDHKDLLTESENEEPLLKVYSLEPSEKIAICRTAKHGSTTWAKNLMHVYLNKKEFVKGPKVYQRELAKLESQSFNLEEKEAVIASFRQRNHLYLTFFVCRNPIERLISVYNYMKVLR